jgi:eukaryotic-like serine/threonine-protein kinase
MSKPESWELQAQLRRLFGAELRIEQEIGRGGMAAVFLAHDPALQRQVAVKLLLPHIARDQDLVQRFLREARTVASLQHPNIVTVFSVRSHEDTHAIVMQFIEGQSLDRSIEQSGALPLPHAARILLEVASALQHAHERGIVHRDVKAANVLLDHAGNAYLTDFGVARRADGFGVTREGMILGSRDYMSPEQRAGERVTAAADQYALGVLAFELLTGHLPFRGTQLEVITAHMEAPPPSLRAHRRDVPASVERIVTRLLAKAPEDRWPSLAEPIASFDRLSRELSGVHDLIEPRDPPTIWRRTRIPIVIASLTGATWVALQWGGGSTPIIETRSSAAGVAGGDTPDAAMPTTTPVPVPSVDESADRPSRAARTAPQESPKSRAPMPARVSPVHSRPAAATPETLPARPLPSLPVRRDSSSTIAAALPATGSAAPELSATLSDARRLTREFVTLLNQRQRRLVDTYPQLGGSATARAELLRLVESARDLAVGFDRIASAPAPWQDGFETTSWIELQWREGRTILRLTLYADARAGNWSVRGFAVTPLDP